MKTVLVWVLCVTTTSGEGVYTSVSSYVIDNIASAESCEQLAKVIRKTNGNKAEATCAPVRKLVVQ